MFVYFHLTGSLVQISQGPPILENMVFAIDIAIIGFCVYVGLMF